jgi:hypothetical protein
MRRGEEDKEKRRRTGYELYEGCLAVFARQDSLHVYLLERLYVLGHEGHGHHHQVPRARGAVRVGQLHDLLLRVGLQPLHRPNLMCDCYGCVVMVGEGVIGRAVVS